MSNPPLDVICLGAAGEVHSRMFCFGCNTTSDTDHQPFKMLPVAISGSTLVDALKWHFKAEVMDGDDNLYFCERCKGYRRASKKLRLSALPTLFVVQLKRFGTADSSKIGGHIPFRDTLALGGVAHAVGSAMYDLRAIVVHSGASIHEGHYYAFVRCGARWLKFDDEIVSEVSWEVVKANEAYLLFYEIQQPQPEQEVQSPVCPTGSPS